MFWSRDFFRRGGADVLDEVETLERCNVVAHASFRTAGSCRTRMWGRRGTHVIDRNKKACLAAHAQFKTGVMAEHMRINTHGSVLDGAGKYLVFDSANTIRAGKHTHADALQGLIVFNAWMRRKCGVRHVWHTAIGCPNMVLSGRLRHTPSPTFKTHWRCNHTEKFPGVAIQTNTRATPEVYPKTGSFIVPGVVTGEGARAALACIREVVKETCVAPSVPVSATRATPS